MEHSCPSLPQNPGEGIAVGRRVPAASGISTASCAACRVARNVGPGTANRSRFRESWPLPPASRAEPPLPVRHPRSSPRLRSRVSNSLRLCELKSTASDVALVSGLGAQLPAPRLAAFRHEQSRLRTGHRAVALRIGRVDDSAGGRFAAAALPGWGRLSAALHRTVCASPLVHAAVAGPFSRRRCPAAETAAGLPRRESCPSVRLVAGCWSAPSVHPGMVAGRRLESDSNGPVAVLV